MLGIYIFVLLNDYDREKKNTVVNGIQNEYNERKQAYF